MRVKQQKQANVKLPTDHKNHNSKHAAHSGLPDSSANEQKPANTVAEACQPVSLSSI